MPRRGISALSHLALWPGVYVAGGVLYCADLAGVKLDGFALWWCIGFALCTGVGGYLFDRVKLKDAWLDDADREAHRERFEFVARHSGAVRLLACGLLAAGMGLGWMHPIGARWMAAVPLLGAGGVIVYAPKGKAGRRRPKDVLVLKNLYVSVGITSFAGLTAWSVSGGGVSELWRSADWAFAGATLLARVFADALLCDLDDQASDLAFGTATVPTVIGRRAARNVGMMIRLGLAGMIAAAPVGPWRVRVAWAAVTAVSSVILRVAAPAKVRDWVDVRFGLEAAAARLLV